LFSEQLRHMSLFKGVTTAIFLSNYSPALYSLSHFSLPNLKMRIYWEFIELNRKASLSRIGNCVICEIASKWWDKYSKKRCVFLQSWRISFKRTPVSESWPSQTISPWIDQPLFSTSSNFEVLLPTIPGFHFLTHLFIT
jgi:hypothetical protein